MGTITTTCLHKYRDKSGKLVGYKLQDTNGNTQDIGAAELKNLISAGQISVNNLTLTSDGRLMPTTPKIVSNNNVSAIPNVEVQPAENPDYVVKLRRKDPAATFAMVDKEAEKAASLLATYKYNDDVKEIRKTDSKIYAYYYHLDRADYNLYKAKYDVYIGKNTNPEKLIVSLQFERSDSDYYTSGRIELEGTEVYAVSSCDVAKSFEQQLERAYPVKSSIKDSMAIKKLQEAQKNGEKSTFKSLFKMFDR